LLWTFDAVSVSRPTRPVSTTLGVHKVTNTTQLTPGWCTAERRVFGCGHDGWPQWTGSQRHHLRREGPAQGHPDEGVVAIRCGNGRGEAARRSHVWCSCPEIP